MNSRLGFVFGSRDHDRISLFCLVSYRDRLLWLQLNWTWDKKFFYHISEHGKWTFRQLSVRNIKHLEGGLSVPNCISYFSWGRLEGDNIIYQNYVHHMYIQFRWEKSAFFSVFVIFRQYFLKINVKKGQCQRSLTSNQSTINRWQYCQRNWLLYFAEGWFSRAPSSGWLWIECPVIPHWQWSSRSRPYFRVTCVVHFVQ